MSVKSIIMEQLRSDKEGLRLKHTYIIKKPYVLLPIATEQTPRRSKGLKQLRSKSHNTHPRKNLITSEKKTQSIENSPRIDFSAPRKNLKTELKRTEKSEKKGKISLFNLQEYKQSLINNENSSPKHKKSLKEYLQFIRALSSQSYEITANFESLRKRHRRQALKVNEKAIIQFILKQFECIYENLAKKTEESSKIIFEACQLYFGCFEKVRTYVILFSFYPNNLHPKIKPFLIYQRLILFLISALCIDKGVIKLARAQIQSLKLIIQLLTQSYIILIEPIKQMQEQVVTNINETFRMLKAVGETERKMQIIEKETSKINFKRQELAEIEEELRLLLKSKEEWQLEQLAQKEMRINWEFLKIPPVPYLPARISGKRYTLVIEIDHTLIFYDKETKILKYRPYIDLFLHRTCQHFEIVAFTRAEHKYTEVLVGQIQRKNRYFSYLLSQQHLSHSPQGKQLKDISRLGRKLSELIVIDHLPSSYHKFQLNGLCIPSWHGDKSDKQLQTTLIILQTMIANNPNDVRDFLKTLRQPNE